MVVEYVHVKVHMQVVLTDSMVFCLLFEWFPHYTHPQVVLQWSLQLILMWVLIQFSPVSAYVPMSVFLCFGAWLPAARPKDSYSSSICPQLLWWTWSLRGPPSSVLEFWLAWPTSWSYVGNHSYCELMCPAAVASISQVSFHSPALTCFPAPLHQCHEPQMVGGWHAWPIQSWALSVIHTWHFENFWVSALTATYSYTTHC